MSDASGAFITRRREIRGHAGPTAPGRSRRGPGVGLEDAGPNSKGIKYNVLRRRSVDTVVGLTWLLGLACASPHLPTHRESERTFEVSEIDNPVEWVWSGALTPRSIRVRARVSRPSASVRLILTPTTTDGAPGVPVRAVSAVADDASLRVATFDVDALTPDTRYTYAVEVDGQIDAARMGGFRTPAAGAFDFTVAFSACARTGSNGAVFDEIASHDPILYIATGDLFYGDFTVNRPEWFRDAYTEVLTAPAQASLYRHVPIAYVFDDHDFGPNNASGRSPSAPAAQETFRAFVPHAPLVEERGPIHRAFTIGRVTFVVTDLRSRRDAPDRAVMRPPRSTMGEAQREWFLGTVREASRTAALVVWVNTSPWIADGGLFQDHWGKYAEERRLIADAFENDGVRNLVMLCGDAHMLAIDDGSHNRYASSGRPGCPVFNAAPLDREGSFKGNGTYTWGPELEGGQYGLMTIRDDGGESIGVTWQGFRVDAGERMRLDMEVSRAGGIRIVSNPTTPGGSPP